MPQSFLKDSGSVSSIRSGRAKRLARDQHGRFTRSGQEAERTPIKHQEPPLVSFQVTNPVVYLKRWWKRVMSSEGVDLRLRIHPITAILISLAIASVGFGLGRISIPSYMPFVQYLVTPTGAPMSLPIPTPDLWRETAFSGILRVTPTTKRYYLVTSSSEAITLEVPTNVDLSTYVGKRILASGKFNKTTRILMVSDVSDLEVLPTKAVTIPTVLPTPTLTPTPTSPIRPRRAPRL